MAWSSRQGGLVCGKLVPWPGYDQVLGEVGQRNLGFLGSDGDISLFDEALSLAGVFMNLGGFDSP